MGELTEGEIFKRGLEKTEARESVLERETIDQIEAVYDKYKNRLKGKYEEKALEFIDRVIIPLMPEIRPASLEKIISGLVKRYEKRAIERYGIDKGLAYYPRDFGFVISKLNKITVEKYTREETEKGKKPEEIKPLKTTIEGILPIDNLGYQNPDKSHVIIKGLARDYVGRGMRGGEILVYDKVGKEIGKDMTGGNIIIYREVEDKSFSFSKKNKGEMLRMRGNKLERVWPKEETEKQEK